MKLVLAILLLALVPPVDYSKKEPNPEPPVIHYNEEDNLIRVEEDMPYEGLQRLD